MYYFANPQDSILSKYSFNQIYIVAFACNRIHKNYEEQLAICFCLISFLESIKTQCEEKKF